MTKQVKSKQRVAERGEVFTAEREVNAMLDLVKQETERIDSRFLEPACGDGNFLVEILRRKLAVVKANYKAVNDFEDQDDSITEQVVKKEKREPIVRSAVNSTYRPTFVAPPTVKEVVLVL